MKPTRIARIVRIATALGLLAAALLLAACASGTTGAADDGAANDAAPAEAPTLTLVSPTEGAAVPAGTVSVAVETTGLKFTMPSNTNVAGEGHVHFTLDDRPFEMSVEPNFEFKDVEAGLHTLKAELVQNDTKSFDPPVEQIIEFTAQ